MLPVMIAVFALLLVSQYVLFKNKPNTPSSRPATQTANTPEAVAPTADASVPIITANQTPASA